MNVNPRSLYNKVEDFHTFVEVDDIDCIFMSESWEIPDQPLEDIIKLPDHQRKGVGGRPALFINQKKFYVKNVTQSLIKIPWGTEAVWAVITSKGLTKESKRIALCSFYSKPDSNVK